ncbi:MAG: thioesterase family protein [Actinomycetota bacterium]|nr:thioesterase family protein [Actinomycetota bacterium]
MDLDLALLLDLLDIEEIDRDLYRARNPDHQQRMLYGGQVAAQALRAAAATVGEQFSVHSAHGYFLRRGRPERPTLLQVHRDRDGRSYSHRRVEAIQNGEVIFSLASSFHIEETGPEMEVPPPAAVFEFDSAIPAGIGQGNPEHLDTFELRVAPLPLHPDAPPGHRRTPAHFWIHPKGVVGDDPLINACIVMFISDMGSGFAEVDLPRQPFGGGPTLDHTVWFHRPIRVDQWLLLRLEPVIATRGRGVYHGGLFDRSGSRLATLSQEIVVRELDPVHFQGVIDTWKRRFP